MSLATVLRRLRHSRGFGIHSPFAYRFITEVLNLPKEYGYYAYLYLPGTVSRTVFRVAVRFSPGKVCLLDAPDEIGKAVACAVPKAAKVGLYDADMVIFNAARQRKLPAAALRPDAVTVILNYKKWKNRAEYMTALPAGMTFSNASTMCVITPLPHLPRQDFDVRF